MSCAKTFSKPFFIGCMPLVVPPTPASIVLSGTLIWTNWGIFYVEFNLLHIQIFLKVLQFPLPPNDMAVQDILLSFTKKLA